jgi:hypothetical protein
MTDQNNINTHLTGDTTPTFTEILLLSGVAPETWAALPTAQKEEWIRVWHARKAGANG